MANGKDDAMSKKLKTEVNYSRGMVKSHCGPWMKADRGYCTHFIPGSTDYKANGTCERVYGEIDPKFWCKLWKKAE